MKLNCDLGEGLDDVDASLMPHIDMASIACGGHVGNNASMSRAVELAIKHDVAIGAHPSYPDKENFGRRSLDITPAALCDALNQQIHDLLNICRSFQCALTYIKPHGALYNDAWHNAEVIACIINVAKNVELPLVLQANIEKQHKIHHPFISEAFADRAYTDEGTLVPRRFPHATHDSIEKTIQQTQDIAEKQGLYSETGKWLPLAAETICIHSDSPNAVENAKSIRQAIRLK